MTKTENHLAASICQLQRIIFGLLVGLVLALTSGCNWRVVNLGKEPTKEPPKLTLAAEGRTPYVITLASDAAPPEQHAAQELAQYLKEVTGAEFAIVAPEDRGDRPTIAVGPGAVHSVAPELKLDGLGQDGMVVRTSAPHLILTGGSGAVRGTLYAVYTFLEDSVGCRWWTAKVSTIPQRSPLVVPVIDTCYAPCFEYREPYSFQAFNPDWSVRNKCNGQSSKLEDAARGGRIGYRGYNGSGFVHTFNLLIPPAEFFPKHPEWFSEINGQRQGPPNRSQWCLTNPDLLAFCIERVKEILKKAPAETIVSISQNDWNCHCECAKCLEIERAEGSPSGPLLRFVNAVADAIKDEYPRAAIDTLAYTYTRKPPLLTKARPNVIIRLCSIECSFAHPLDHERNKAFAEDLRGWEAICQRIYVWDYITDFSHYLLPFPNLRVLGPNVRFFAKNGVKGVFEQGNSSAGGEFSELRTWVLAKLLWNPAMDEKILIQQFLDGYYGPAAPMISEYLRLLHDSVEKTDFLLTCYTPSTAPYLTAELLIQAEGLFQKAEAAVQDRPDVLGRVQLAHASIQYAVLSAWPKLKNEAHVNGLAWPFGEDPQAPLKQFFKTCEEQGVTKVAEASAGTVANFKHKFEKLVGQHDGVEPPPMCKGLKNTDWIDFQEDSFNLASQNWAELRPDPAASNGKAARMTSNHTQWAVQWDIPLPLWLEEPDVGWTVYVVVRVTKQGKGAGTAFSCGMYDSFQRKSRNVSTVPLAEIKDDKYHAYRVGRIAVTDSGYIYVAPTANKDNVADIWIDRIFLVREPAQTKH
jgi:hypothetical protein